MRASVSNDIGENLCTASEKDGVVAKSVGDIVKGPATGDRLGGVP